jgi:hypothetical protein
LRAGEEEEGRQADAGLKERVMQADAPASCPKCHSASVNLFTTFSNKTAATGGTEHKVTKLDPPDMDLH